MASSLSFDKWKEVLRNDCIEQDRLAAFNSFSDYVFKLLYEDGVDPTVEAIVKNGSNELSKKAKQS